MKGSTVLAIAFAAAGAVMIFGRKAKASGPHVQVVDSEFAALAVAAKIMAGGRWVVVASTHDHRDEILAYLRDRASKRSGNYVYVDMDIARKVAKERGAEIPNDVWGAVTLIENGSGLRHVDFGDEDDIQDAMTKIAGVDDTAINDGNTIGSPLLSVLGV